MTVEPMSMEDVKLEYQELKLAFEKNDIDIRKLHARDQNTINSFKELLCHRHKLNERIKILNANFWRAYKSESSTSSSTMNRKSECANSFQKDRVNEKTEILFDESDDRKCAFEYNSDDSCDERSLTPDNESIVEMGKQMHRICNILASSSVEDEPCNKSLFTYDGLNKQKYAPNRDEIQNCGGSTRSFGSLRKKDLPANRKVYVDHGEMNYDSFPIGDSGLSDGDKESARENEEKLRIIDHWNQSHQRSAYSEGSNKINPKLPSYKELEKSIGISESSENDGDSQCSDEASDEDGQNLFSTVKKFHFKETETINNVVGNFMEPTPVDVQKTMNEIRDRAKSRLRRRVVYVTLVVLISSSILYAYNSKIYREMLRVVRNLVHYLFHWNEEWYLRKWGPAPAVKPTPPSNSLLNFFLKAVAQQPFLQIRI